MASDSNQSHWIPLSDLMTGMMLVFMLIAIVFMVRVQQVATDLRDTKGKIYTALDKEFGKDLKKWDAEILKDLTIRFKNPESLFKLGSYDLQPKFNDILEDFLPRYFEVLNNNEFKTSVKEILIEGHTDPTFKNSYDDDCFKMKTSSELKIICQNIALSQDRSQSVYIKALEIMQNKQDIKDFVAKVHPHDVGSSYPILNSVGEIDFEKSRRVEFKLITNAEERLEEIAEKLTRK
jgi:outer membrane protein OmpA-like peptidoglycan-associated protein